MTPFEDQLRKALRPAAPPPGFVGRTLALAARQERRPERVIRFPRYLAALAASLALFVFGLQYRDYREGQKAKEQLMIALQITGTQLNQVQQKFVNAGPEE